MIPKLINSDLGSECDQVAKKYFLQSGNISLSTKIIRKIRQSNVMENLTNFVGHF